MLLVALGTLVTGANLQVALRDVAAVGLFNGVMINILGIPAIIVTLAMNGVMQSAGLLYSGGFAQGQAPAILVGLFSATVFRPNARQLALDRDCRPRHLAAEPQQFRSPVASRRQQSPCRPAVGDRRSTNEASCLYFERILCGIGGHFAGRLQQTRDIEHGRISPVVFYRGRSRWRHCGEWRTTAPCPMVSTARNTPSIRSEFKKFRLSVAGPITTRRAT
nr:hypothetical protein [Mesorhizobium sp.]